MTTQRRIVQETLFSVQTSDGTVATGRVVDEALARDRRDHDGRVFHGGRTPRNSVRRTLAELEGEGLVIRDGRGSLRIKLAGLVDTVVHGDVLDLLRLVPDDSLPIVHADPPWSYMEEHTSKGTTTRKVGADSQWFETGDLPEEVIQEIHRVLKPGGVFLCWFPPVQEVAEGVRVTTLAAIRKTSLKRMRTVTWFKGVGSGYGWRIASEPCLVFYKKRRPKFFDLTVCDVLVYDRLKPTDKTQYADYTLQDAENWKRAKKEYGSDKNIPPEFRATLKTRSHGCEKPVEMVMELLRPVLVGKHGRAGPGDNLVLDIYSGSASCSEAARRLGFHFCAVELDARTVDSLILPRLGEAVQRVIELQPAVVQEPV